MKIYRILWLDIMILGECITNLVASMEHADSWAVKFRMISGRALDKANLILNKNFEFGDMSARVSNIQLSLTFLVLSLMVLGRCSLQLLGRLVCLIVCFYTKPSRLIYCNNG